MHQVHDTSRVTTIIGLVVEGLAIITFAIFAIFFRNMSLISKEQLLSESGMTEFEADLLLGIADVSSVILVVLATVVGLMFLINLALFVNMFRGKCSQNLAQKIYIYQTVWGGISLIFNPITGILYLISAVKGQLHHNYVEEKS